MSLVWKMWFGLHIRVIYYLCNSWMINIQQIFKYYSITAMLNELHIPNFDIVKWYSKIYTLHSVYVVFWNVHYQHIKVIFATFNLNCRLHTVSVGKLSEGMSNFERFCFLKIESKPIFGFLHSPSGCFPIMVQLYQTL